MNKWYFGLPLLMLVLFFVLFWRFDSKYEAGRLEIAAQERVAREAELRAQMQERLRAAQEAKRISDENRRQREADKAREEEEKQMRQDAIAKRDSTASELGRARRLHGDVTGDLSDEEERLKKVQEDHAFLLAEKEFLTEYIKRADGNATRMLSLTEKIDAAAAKVVAQIEAASAPPPAR